MTWDTAYLVLCIYGEPLPFISICLTHILIRFLYKKYTVLFDYLSETNASNLYMAMSSKTFICMAGWPMAPVTFWDGYVL
jgi:hypothetical protein